MARWYLTVHYPGLYQSPSPECLGFAAKSILGFQSQILPQPVSCRRPVVAGNLFPVLMLAPYFKEFSRLAQQATLLPVAKTVASALRAPVSALLTIAADAPNAFLR